MPRSRANGGETWIAGTNQNITLNATNETGVTSVTLPRRLVLMQR